MNKKELWNDIRPPSGADPLIMAALLAWLGLSAQAKYEHGSSDVPDFDDDLEVTTARWFDIVGALRRKRGWAGDQWIFDGVEEAAKSLRPGELENLRQHFRISVGQALILTDSIMVLAEEILRRTAKHTSSYPNRDLVELIAGIVKAGHNDHVYCVYDASAPVALHMANYCQVHLHVEDRLLAQISGLLGISANINLHVYHGSPLLFSIQSQNDNVKTPDISLPHVFDHVISFPPFGAKFTSEFLEGGSTSVDSLQMKYILNKGKMWRLCIVTDGFLFRSSSINQEAKWRLLNDPRFHAVVTLPRGLFGPNFGVSISMIMLSPFVANGIAFIDGRRITDNYNSYSVTPPDQHGTTWTSLLISVILHPEVSNTCWIATRGEIEANDYNLVPDRYVVPLEIRTLRERQMAGQTTPLDEIAEIHKVPAIPTVPDDGDVMDLSEVALGDIRDARVLRPSKNLIVSEATFRKNRKFMLQQGDIIVSIKGKIGVVGVVPNLENEMTCWVPSQSFAIIRVRRSARFFDPLILATYLRSSIGQRLLASLAGGATVQMVAMNDLRNLPVLTIGADAQSQIRHHLGEIENLIKMRDDINRRIEAIEQDLQSDFFK